MTGIVATLPMPMPWPEQDVKVVAQDVTPQVRSVRFRVLGDGVKQMVVSIPQLSAGEEATALLTLEIVKRDIVAPLSTEQVRVPSPVPRELRPYLSPSPYIESDDRKIQESARQVVTGKDKAWKQAEAIFDWVRAKVEYRFDRQIKGARQALDDGIGDCEELTSLFVAMCRVSEFLRGVCGCRGTAIRSSTWKMNKAKAIGIPARSPVPGSSARCRKLGPSCKRGTVFTWPATVSPCGMCRRP